MGLARDGLGDDMKWESMICRLLLPCCGNENIWCSRCRMCNLIVTALQLCM